MKIIYKDGHVDECPQDQELHVIRHTAAHIIVEAVLGGRAEGEISLRIQALDGLRHDVGCGVADNVQFLILRALVHMTVDVYKRQALLHCQCGPQVLCFQPHLPHRR